VMDHLRATMNKESKRAIDAKYFRLCFNAR
jgi:hypothetical protein